jgi:CRISPR system Cascade subunit CasC
MFVTVHILHALPLHNLNRDQSGLPKSQFDGGVQRARLSSQALKRAARSTYLERARTGTSLRTKNATDLVLALAVDYATTKGLPFDEKTGRASIKKVVDGLAKAEKTARDDKPETASDVVLDSPAEKGNILFFARAELEILARAAVDRQQDGSTLSSGDFILDATSPSLDVAAFGRMFAAASEIGTHAAIAVSHAATTHQMALTSDYFSAIDDASGETHAGAAHIGMAYYTSGVYYRTFTIDTDQLRRSWSSIDADGAAEDLSDLIRALILALPTGRLSNSNAHTQPLLVLAEEQKMRIAYEFDTPVNAEADGGYKKGTVTRLAEQRRLAQRFDPTNVTEAILAGQTYDEDFADVETGGSVDTVVDFVVAKVLGV